MHNQVTPEALPQDFTDRVLVRLFRKWSAARLAFADAFPEMETVCNAVGLEVDVVAASASLFDLLEMHLARHLVPECCCSARFSADEHAIVAIVRSAPSLIRSGGEGMVPRGLPDNIVLVARWLHASLGSVSLSGHPRAPERDDGRRQAQVVPA